MHRDAAEEQVGQVPPWLDVPTLRAMEAERARILAWGRDALAARNAVRDVLLARRPALPLPMIEAAVAAVVPDAEGGSYAPPVPAEGERAATSAEVAETLSYALRFGLDGKPRRTGHEHLAPLAAAQLAEHLMRANFRITRRAPVSGLHGEGW
ncbi:hypothetical protein [Roseomonas rosulenta]|uniref:hypothetical protein n=1 Tax=Roseomonas rosulenta TaxID=2748667 RepID=UPI0018DF9611|nr:hypothetical protein [Roseomonas rosulenta]